MLSLLRGLLFLPMALSVEVPFCFLDFVGSKVCCRIRSGKRNLLQYKHSIKAQWSLLFRYVVFYCSGLNNLLLQHLNSPCLLQFLPQRRRQFLLHWCQDARLANPAV